MRGGFGRLDVDDVRAVTGYAQEVGQLFCVIPEKLRGLFVLGQNLHFETIAGKPHPYGHEAELRRLQLEVQNPQHAPGGLRHGDPVQTVLLEGYSMWIGQTFGIIDDRIYKMLEC